MTRCLSCNEILAKDDRVCCSCGDPVQKDSKSSNGYTMLLAVGFHCSARSDRRYLRLAVVRGLWRRVPVDSFSVVEFPETGHSFTEITLAQPVSRSVAYQPEMVS